VDETESDEVEYNFGRAFQQLGEEVPSAGSRLVAVLTVGIGLHSLAVKHYERVLEIAEKKTKTDPNVGSSPNEE
jgi:general transcription factor 3C polypeptide 3 (transcription factor C subunit 4)